MMEGSDPGRESPGFLLCLNVLRNDIMNNPNIPKRDKNDADIIEEARKAWKNCKTRQSWENLAAAAKQGMPDMANDICPDSTPGFILHLNQHRNDIKMHVPNFDDVIIIKSIRGIWNNLSDERREKYEDIARAAKQGLVWEGKPIAGEKRKAESSPAAVGAAKKKKAKIPFSNKYNKYKGKVAAASKKKKKAHLASKKRKKAAPLTNKKRKRKSKAPVADKKRKYPAPAASKKKKAKAPLASKKKKAKIPGAEKKNVTTTAAKRRKSPVPKRR